MAASFLASFFPLRDLADAADLMEAGARVPAQAPNRARRMLAYLVNKARSIATTAGLNDFQIDQLLERLGGRLDRTRPLVSSVARTFWKSEIWRTD